MNIDYIRLKKVLNQIIDKECRSYSVKALISTDLVYLFSNRYEPLRQLRTISTMRFLLQIRIAYRHHHLVELCSNYDIILSVLFNYREDHRQFMEEIRARTNNSKLLNNEKWSPQHFFSIRNLFDSIRSIIFLNDLYIKEKIHLLVILTRNLNTLSLLEKTFSAANMKCNKFVAFNSPYGYDAILTEFFHKKGIKTFSIQHGIYYQYKEYVPYDIINYLFTNTDTVLCWGKESVRVLKHYGVSESKLAIAGNPKYSGINISKVSTSFQNAIVILGRYIYDEGNLRLLDLLSVIQDQLKVSFVLKLHPSLFREDLYNRYESIATKHGFKIIPKDVTLTECLKSDAYDFSVSYNTGSYVESYMFGKISLRYNWKENEVLLGLEDTFGDVTSFSKRINYFKTRDPQLLKKDVRKLADDILGFSYDEYKAMLSG